MIDFKQKMEEKEKDLHREQEIEKYLHNKKRKKKSKYIIIILVLIVIFSGKEILSNQDSTSWIPENSFLGKITHLINSEDRKLKGEDRDRINVLLLGMGGKGHDGAYLTDTIILVSIQPSTKKIALISIPRDLSGPINNSSTWMKINHINAYAEAKNPGSGGEATIKALSQLFQIPIDYYVRVDFNGFVNIINELGGITVNVENTLDDYSYPIQGQEDNPDYYSRFEHLHIDKGEQTMDGKLALKYARSRHAYGIEGSDFARAKRQQLILEAVKEKLLKKKNLLRPGMISRIVSEFKNNISTNLSTWEIIKLWELTKEVNNQNIIRKILNDAPDNYLIATTGENGAFLLIPKTGNFTDIRKMIRNIFNNSTHTKTIPIQPIGKGSRVIIINGTWTGGLANKTKTKLEQYKYDIVSIGNAPTRDYSTSLIYDLTYGNKNSQLKGLEKISSAHQVFNLPEWIKDRYGIKNDITDFILILGKDCK